MGILDRFTGLFRTERRSSPTSWDYLQSIKGWTGNNYSRSAENLSTVFACVQAISSAVASLPACVYKRSGSDRIEEHTQRLSRLIRGGPNDRQTWPDFIEMVMAQALLHGNAIIQITRDNSGEAQSLECIPWPWITPQLLPTGRLAFDVYAPTIAGSFGRRRRLLQSEVIHVKDRTDDGLIGRSRLSRTYDVVNGAGLAQTFAGSFFKNAASPSGIIQAPERMSKEGMQDLRNEVERHYTGSERAGRVMIVPGGMKWEQTSISPEDSELLDTRRFSVEELCRVYQVPPPIVQDYTHNTFTNSETAGRWFAQFTIGPWARKLEAEFSRAIFGPDSDLELEFDLSGFLRGDPFTRWQSYQIAIANRVLTPNEVRQVEGWNPRPGGDQFDAPVQMPNLPSAV